jgi:hypothetical protein
MTVALEGPRRLGPSLAVAAICERRVGARTAGGGLAGLGAKRPLALIVIRAGAVAVFQPDGRPMPLARAEALLPGLIGALGLGEPLGGE